MFNLKKISQADIKLDMGTLISINGTVYEILDIKLQIEAFGYSHTLDFDVQPIALHQLQIEDYWFRNIKVSIEVYDSQMLKTLVGLSSAEQARALRVPTPEELAQYKREVGARDGEDELGNPVDENGNLIVEEII